MINRVSEIRNYYNSRYAGLGDRAFRPRDAYPEFLDHLNPSPGKRLLDIGCGNGFLLSAAEQKGLETYGIDISDEAVKLARSNAPKSEIKTGRAETLDYPDDYFDYVTSLGTIEHCLDISRALSEIYRVSRKDSRVCIMVPNSNYVMWKMRGEPGTEQQDINEQLFSLKEWRSILSTAGLSIQKTLQDKWGARNTPVLVRQGLMSMLRSVIFKTMWYFMPLGFTYQFIFLCTKKDNRDR